MTNSITNTQAANLIDKAYNADGSFTKQGSKHYQREANAIFATGYDGEGEYYKGFDVYIALLILANPNKDI